MQQALVGVLSLRYALADQVISSCALYMCMSLQSTTAEAVGTCLLIQSKLW